MPVPSSVVTKSAVTTVWPRGPKSVRKEKGGSYRRPNSSLPGTDDSTTASSPSTRSTSDSARMNTSSPTRARAYETSGCTASAAFDSSVHGVVVQASKETPGSPTTGKRTYTDGSTTSRYPCATSCDDSAVSQRGQYGTTLWPSYSSPLSHTCLSAHQTDSM